MSKESKHDHKATKCLKTWIFSLVMLAPFIAIGIKCLYVIKNENAKDSYIGSYAFDTTTNLATYKANNNIQNQSYTINNTNYYYLDSSEIQNSYYTKPLDTTNTFRCNIAFYTTNLEFNNYVFQNKTIQILEGEINGIINFRVYDFIIDNTYYFGTGKAPLIYNSNGVAQTHSALVDYRTYAYDNTKENVLRFTLNSNIYTGSAQPNNYWMQKLYTNLYYVDTTLSSVFYSAVQELDKASIFSWTTNTGTYTAINNMCTTLGIVSPPLAVLITYWTLISVIYIIIDIVLETLIYLTHWINDKMI